MSEPVRVRFIEGDEIFPLPTYITRPRLADLSPEEIEALQKQLRRDIAELKRLQGGKGPEGSKS